MELLKELVPGCSKVHQKFEGKNLCHLLYFTLSRKYKEILGVILPLLVPDFLEKNQMGDVSLNRPIKAEPAAGRNAQGNRILNMMSAGWTDERHMLYISSMEASFVEQLYDHEHIVNQNDSIGSGFKVLRGGVWEKIKFRRTNSCARIGNKYCLPASPWIKHFRPRDCSNDARGDGAEALVGDYESDYESGIQTIRGRTPFSHGREWEACKGESHLDESTEVSDQNFADDEVEVDAKSSKACKKRRLSSTSITVPNDQVNSQG